MVEVLALVLAVATGLVSLARRWSLPYPALLVFGGIAISLVPGLPQVALEPSLVFLVFMPPLLFVAGLGTSWRELWQFRRPVLLLGVGLVLVTMVLVAVVAKALLPDLPWAVAFLLGAILSPSDTVATLAVTATLPVPRRLTAIIEGESLVNDAVGLTAYKFALAASLTGVFELSWATAGFAWNSVGGLLLGLAGGWLVAQLQRRLDNPPIQGAISLLTPYTVYLVAERLGSSGVIATVVTGLFLGWHSQQVVSGRMRLLVVPMWNMVEFLLNAAIFMLIGLQMAGVLSRVEGREWAPLLTQTIAIVGTVMVTRLLWVFPGAYLPRLLPSVRAKEARPPLRHVLVTGWAGMRGVISLAAALALPVSLPDGSPFPFRDELIFFTAATILGTLVIQGLSLRPLIQLLQVRGDSAGPGQEAAAWEAATLAGLAHIDELARRWQVPSAVAARARAALEARVARCQLADTAPAPAEAPSPSPPARPADQLMALEQAGLRAQRQTLSALRDEGALPYAAYRTLVRRLDVEEVRLSEGG